MIGKDKYRAAKEMLIDGTTIERAAEILNVSNRTMGEISRTDSYDEYILQMEKHNEYMRNKRFAVDLIRKDMDEIRGMLTQILEEIKKK